MLVRRAVEREVDLVPQQRPVELVREAEGDAQLGMGVEQRAELLHQDHRAELDRRPEDDELGHAGPPRRQPPLGVVERGEDVPADRVQLGALLGQGEPAAAPLDERHAEPVLQLAHRVADRRLRDVQPAGGGGVAVPASGLVEYAQLGEIERHRLSSGVPADARS